MGTISLPDPVKAIYGVLYKERGIFEKNVALIESQFGPVDFLSEEFPFIETDYYESEMGADLIRRYLSLDKLILPETLVTMKLLSNQWEEDFAINGNRRINLDPGYITGANLILASTKNFYQRVYLSEGIYAEVTMHYCHGDYHKLPWTYPDYFNHKDVFQQIRRMYMGQLKSSI